MFWLALIHLIALPPLAVMQGPAPVLAGLFCMAWAGWMHVRLHRLQKRARLDRAAAEAVQNFRDALLMGAAQGVVILGGADQECQYFGEGKSLYQSCMDSPQARKAIRAIDDLGQGISFTLSLKGPQGPLILRGVSVAGRAVLYIHRDSLAGDRERHRDILEALPIPVWMRGADNAIAWANEAFLSLLGFASLEEAVAANAALEWSERDLAGKVLAGRRAIQCRVSVIAKGQARAFSMGLTPIADAGVVGFATDIGEHVRLESKLQLACDAQEDMIEHIPFGVAVFDPERRLSGYNGAYAEMWEMPRAWLDSHPSYSEILERLRDKRRLPEQRNFAEWKAGQLKAFSQAGQHREEYWHLPNGKSIRIVIQPHLQGGVFVLFQDMTERLRLESSLNLLTQVQKATLDTLDQGIAIFGTDGRLVLHNNLFAGMWQLGENELAGQPHFAQIASYCTARIGRDGIWNIVSRGVNALSAERFGEWGKIRRADGRIISLALSRLPNGATVVSFTDLTDLEQFSTIEADRPNAAA